MKMNWQNVIPMPIPTKRASPPKSKMIDMHDSYTKGITAEASKTSKLFREKVQADRKRLGLS